MREASSGLRGKPLLVHVSLRSVPCTGLVPARPDVHVSPTQVDNRAVQRVWVKEGFRLDDSYFTVHLNLT